MTQEKNDQGGTSLTEGAAVSVSASDQRSHDATYIPGPWHVHHQADATGYPCFYIHGLAGDDKRDTHSLNLTADVIKAAPDLLEALKFVMAFYEPDANQYLDTEAWKRAEQQARTAIAKAEGR